jgi:hypothetical protein
MTSTSTPKEYPRDVRACERLWSSVSTYLRGIGLYGSNYDGDLENSFSTLYKAWDQLWQADRTSSHKNPNGKFFKKENSIFGLTDYMNAVEDNKLTGEDFEQYLYYILNIYKFPEPSKDSQDCNSVATDVFNEYDFRLAAPFFRKIHHKQHPARINLLLLKTIRNYDQHDRIEESTKSNSVLITAMNPYIIANAVNYYEAYLDVYLKVKSDCNNNCRGGRPKCHFSSLPYPNKVIMDIKIPEAVPYSQLISRGFSKGYDAGMDKTKNKAKEAAVVAEQTALGWKISEAIKQHDDLFNYSSDIATGSLFGVIYNRQDPFSISLDKVSYELPYKVATKKPKEIDRRAALSKINQKLPKILSDIKADPEGSRLNMETLIDNPAFPYLVKFYDKSDGLILDEINSVLIRKAIEAYRYGSLSEVVDALNKNPHFPFVTNLHTIKNALTILEKENLEEFMTMKIDFFGKTRFHVRIVDYLDKYKTELEYLKICKKPQYKSKLILEMEATT